MKYSQPITRRELLKKGIQGGLVLAFGKTLTGCVKSGKSGGLFGDYGKLSSSDEITESFENYIAKPDHTYFIAGTNLKSPSAILALDNRYELDIGSSWHLLSSQDSLEKLVKNML